MPRGYAWRSFVVALCLALSGVIVQAQGWPPRNGATLPPSCTAGETFFLTASGTTKYHECTATNTWSSVADQATGGTGVPAGVIVLSLTSCPTGFEEETSLSGKFVLGTVAANDDVTDTGGSDSITPRRDQ